MEEKMNCYLRHATLDDSLLLLQWANDPEVRRNSFSTTASSPEEHAIWYKNVMKQKDTKQYILVCNDENIGQIRITADGSRAQIGCSIGVDYRGRGYGKIIFALLPSKVHLDMPQIKTLVAKVKSENIASKKALIDNGFIEKYSAFELNITAY